MLYFEAYRFGTVYNMLYLIHKCARKPNKHHFPRQDLALTSMQIPDYCIIGYLANKKFNTIHHQGMNHKEIQ